MTRGKYGFQMIFRHSNSLAIESRKLFKVENHSIGAAFAVLDALFDYLQQQPKSPDRNVKLVLLTRFINHLVSAHLLLERGLILDAHNPLRSALESTAFYWLVCLDPASAENFLGQKSPRPVEIRRRVEELGADVSGLREEYSFLSEVSHVGNPTENIQLDWQSINDATLLVGGGRNVPVQRHLLAVMPNMIGKFLLYEPAMKDAAFPYEVRPQ